MSGHCHWSEHGCVACNRHLAEAILAADQEEREYREAREHLPAKEVARGAQGARTHAYQRAIERPLTPCDDGSPGMGWTDIGA